jgi:hypothetical protein
VSSPTPPSRNAFFGPVAVDGDFNSSTFGKVVKAAPPRLVQIALKFTF